MRERILVIARGFECEEEFYDQEKSSAPTIEELRANQTESGYPSGHTANFSEPRPRAWPCPENEFTSSMTLNALTLNHENYTKNAKLNGRELASMLGFHNKSAAREDAVAHQRTRRLSQRGRRIPCDDNEDQSRELMMLFIRHHRRPIVRFFRGSTPESSFGKILFLSDKSKNWGTAVRVSRCYFGTELNSNYPEHDSPTSDCLGGQTEVYCNRMPPTSAVREGFKQSTMPPIAEHMRDAITADGSKSVNSFCRRQQVYTSSRPGCGTTQMHRLRRTVLTA